MGGKLKAVTFDFWDTIVKDDSDEAVRAARGLRSKYDERRYLIWQALDRQAPTSLDDVRLAFSVADAAFITAWKAYSVTWTLEERIAMILKGMDRTLPDDDVAGLVDAIGRMEADIPPDLLPGIADAIAELATRYKLCIVSDTIVTPGLYLRQALANHGLKPHFTGFVYSDEVGHSKPHRAMFDEAARQLGTDFSEMVHIGDRDQKDVQGPHALGMKAVLYTGSRDHDKATTTADAICETHADLPAIIDSLAA
ncbi:MAG: HAD family hydrolase [Hyphomicrobiales bacterium]|nr:HAD family hydrolase [Hyphomicrobiales bacterium]MCP5374005.1 HAD family hydrolase [Hyphomicrobiales bacterium]